MALHRRIRTVLNVALILCIPWVFGCTDRTKAYQSLSAEQRNELFENEKRAVIHREICNGFIQELYEYRTDLKEKELKRFHEYFREYPYQFRRLQLKPLYPIYRNIVSQTLQHKGINYDPDFKDWPPPNLEDLDCQEKIAEWTAAKRQWHTLMRSLPAELYKQKTVWDDFVALINELTEWGTKAFYATVAFIVILSITIYSFVLHFALISKKNREGLWLIVATPLSAMYWQKHLKFLKANGYDFSTRVAVTAVILSASFFAISFVATYVIKTRKKKRDDAADANRKAEARRTTSLFQSLKISRLELVEQLLEADPGLAAARNEDGFTPLHFISRKQNVNNEDIEAVHLLLSFGGDPNATTLSGSIETALHLVSSHGQRTTEHHVHLAEILLENGCDVDKKNVRGVTTYRQILEDGVAELMPLLEVIIARQPDPVLEIIQGEGTSLTKSAPELLERAERYERFRNEPTIVAKDEDLASFLKEITPKIFEVVAAGDVKGLVEMLKVELDIVHSRNSHGWTPLHVVASLGEGTRPEHGEIAAILLDAGANVDSNAPLGWTPLHMIAINGASESIPVLKVLFRYKANPLALANDGIANWRMLWQHGQAVFSLIDQYEKKYLGNV
jgi:ankyrin repeat protein